jgi:O-antigen/teichoic acid export membrane protein
VSFWQAARLGGQALWVLAIARLLGPGGYGLFIGVAGLATTLGGLTGLGQGLVLLQDASREPALFDERWRKAIGTCLASGIAFAALFALAGPWLFGAALSPGALALIGLSELLLYPVVTTAAFAFSARQRMGMSAALPAVVALGRVLAALACWLAVPSPTLDAYVGFHAAATALCALGAWWWVHARLRPARVPFALGRRDTAEGLGFSLMWMVGNALTSLDKTLVLRLAGAQAAGQYGAAYRLATLLAMPVDALTMAAGPRLFRHGGGRREPGLVARLALAALGYALLAAGVLWLAAGLLPWLLGPAFAPAVPAARWMALFVPCYGLRLLGSNVLMASDRKKLRVLIEGLGLLCLLAAAPLLVPGHGALGAVAMIVATEALLAAAAWAAVLASRRRV